MRFVMVRAYTDLDENTRQFSVDVNIGGASGKNYHVTEYLTSGLLEGHFDYIWRHLGEKMKAALKEAGH